MREIIQIYGLWFNGFISNIHEQNTIKTCSMFTYNLKNTIFMTLMLVSFHYGMRWSSVKWNLFVGEVWDTDNRWECEIYVLNNFTRMTYSPSPIVNV